MDLYTRVFVIVLGILLVAFSRQFAHFSFNVNRPMLRRIGIELTEYHLRYSHHVVAIVGAVMVIGGIVALVVHTRLR